MTAAALHTQREHADWLVTTKHAAYLLIVKHNQPALHHRSAPAAPLALRGRGTSWPSRGTCICHAGRALRLLLIEPGQQPLPCLAAQVPESRRISRAD